MKSYDLFLDMPVTHFCVIILLPFLVIIYWVTFSCNVTFSCYHFSDVLSKTTQLNLLISLHEEVFIDLDFIFYLSLSLSHTHIMHTLSRLSIILSGVSNGRYIYGQLLLFLFIGNHFGFLQFGFYGGFLCVFFLMLPLTHKYKRG